MNRVKSNPVSRTNNSPITSEQLAQQHGYKQRVVNGKVEYHGANPTGTGATKDGYWINEDGTSYDRKLRQRYNSKTTAEIHGIDPMDYEPYASWRRRNG